MIQGELGNRFKEWRTGRKLKHARNDFKCGYICMALYVWLCMYGFVCMAMYVCMAIYVWLCMYGYVSVLCSQGRQAKHSLEEWKEKI